MEIEEIFITSINAIAMVFGFSAVLYNIVYIFAKQRIKFFIVYVILCALGITVSFVEVTYLPIVLCIASCTYLCITKTKWQQSVLSSLIAVIIFLSLMSLNTIVALIIKLPAEKIVELRSTIPYNLFNAVTFILETLIALFALNEISRRLHLSSTVPSINNSLGNDRLVIFISITITLFIAIISAIWTISLIDYKNGFFYMLFGTIITFLLLAFAAFAIYTVISMASQKKKEFEIQRDKEIAEHVRSITELYRNEIQEMYDNVCDFKHDYMKIYSSMSQLLNEDNIEKAKDYFNTEIAPLQAEIFQAPDTNYTITSFDDSIVQGLVYNYIIRAKRSLINFTVEVGERIPAVTTLNSAELSRILGIFLDNAFEAAAKSTDHIVILCAVKNDDSVIYIIKNTYAIKPSIPKIFEKDYSTKGGCHGKGLAIVKKIIDKYSNVYTEIALNDDFFITKIYFCN